MPLHELTRNGFTKLAPMGPKVLPCSLGSADRLLYTLENVRTALGAGRGHDASFEPFQTDAEERADAPIRVRDIKLCAHVVAMDRNLHVHCKSCQKGKRGQDGCRFSVPYGHGHDQGRCLQLVKYEPQLGDRFAPADARWCPGCVIYATRAEHYAFRSPELARIVKRSKLCMPLLADTVFLLVASRYYGCIPNSALAGGW
eukprot:SAG25_NODE_810_length_5237_cov_5.091086_2_plen_200_part_00